MAVPSTSMMDGSAMEIEGAQGTTTFPHGLLQAADVEVSLLSSPMPSRDPEPRVDLRNDVFFVFFFHS